MRVMVLMKANDRSEAGEMPSERIRTEMTEFNEQLASSGLLLGGEGLTPSSRGVRVRFEDDTTSVIEGPFSATEELLAGFWLLQVSSLDQAIEWVSKVPNPENLTYEIEIRPVFETEDFGDAMTPELREREQRLREAESQLIER